MEHEFIQTSNEYLQYLSDLGRFAVQNLEISARQEELIKDKLGKVILYIVTKRDSDSSLKTNKDVAKAEHDFLEIPLQIRNEYCNRSVCSCHRRADNCYAIYFQKNTKHIVGFLYI